jgi:hypothetical protein
MDKKKNFSYQNSKTQLRSVASFWSSGKDKRKKCKTGVEDWSQEKIDWKDPAMTGRDSPR